MTRVQIFFAPPTLQGSSHFRNPKTLHLIMEHRGAYTLAGELTTPLTGEAAAEEAFDLTNNPCREREREEVYGRGRSVSVGDICRVDDAEDWVCMSSGWQQLIDRRA